jgi:hypothetical protein
MSGGEWDYLSQKLEAAAEGTQKAAEALRLLAAIEHEIDWGISADTCYACAKLRVIAALEDYFSGGACGVASAIALVRDQSRNRCPDCKPVCHCPDCEQLRRRYQDCEHG